MMFNNIVSLQSSVTIFLIITIPATLSTAFVTVSSSSFITPLLTNTIHIDGIHHENRRMKIVAASQSDEEDNDTSKQVVEKDDEPQLASNIRRALLASTLTAITYNIITIGIPALGRLNNPGYEKVSPLQFIAALGDENASSGSGAESWGLWQTDPGPQGLSLQDYKHGNAIRPTWLDDTDFFLDENAIIMPMPQFPLPAGKYLVTGARTVTTGLTIDNEGNWKLDDGKLYDVTHLPCRAARYQRVEGEDGSPARVKGGFPVRPGGLMPSKLIYLCHDVASSSLKFIEHQICVCSRYLCLYSLIPKQTVDVAGTDKQIYSVLFIIGKQSV